MTAQEFREAVENAKRKHSAPNQYECPYCDDFVCGSSKALLHADKELQLERKARVEAEYGWDYYSQLAEEAILDNQQLRKERDQLKAERDEQARLNGMGSEREAKLMAELEQERARITPNDLKFIGAVNKYSELVDKYNKAADRIVELQAELEQERKARGEAEANLTTEINEYGALELKLLTAEAEVERQHEIISRLHDEKASQSMDFVKVVKALDDLKCERDQLKSQVEQLTSSNTKLSAQVAELSELLKAYVDRDDCDADGAPDANNSRHSKTCLSCKAQFALASRGSKVEELVSALENECSCVDADGVGRVLCDACEALKAFKGEE